MRFVAYLTHLNLSVSDSVQHQHNRGCSTHCGTLDL